MNDWDDDLLDDDLLDDVLNDDVFDAADDIADATALDGNSLDAFDDEQADEDDQPGEDELDRDFESVFAAAAAAVTEAAGITVVEVAEVDALAVEPLPARPAAPPRPILVRDKLLTYLSLPVFSEFANLVTAYGELLATRYAEVRLPADLQELVTRFPDVIHIVAVVTEGDPDTAAVLPIVARLVDASVRLDLRIVEDEDEDSLRPLALLLPDLDIAAALDEWDLPQIFLFDEEWEIQAQWGPRPAAADASVEAWLAAHPDYEVLEGEESPAAVVAHAELTHALLYEMRVWYNSGLTRACLDEWRDLLLGLLPADEPEPNGERS